MKKKPAKPQFEQTFIVDRAKWHNADTFKIHATYLLSTGKIQKRMCCLGFVCNQLGIPEKDLLDKRTPSRVALDWDIPYLMTSAGYHTDLSRCAMDINDDDTISSDKREKKLKDLFNQHNLDLKFIGKAPKR